MSKDKGKDDHQHYEAGHNEKIHVLLGTKGDDVIPGTDGRDLIIGKKGDDQIDGGAGNDILVGGKGNDLVFGDGGNDLVSGGKDEDQVDGGAGNDWVLAGKGDDLANYTPSENLGAHDVYDGGKGFDTLQLTLTWAEWNLASVQADIEAFEAFLERPGHGHGGKTFQFQSFDLDVRGFEDLKIVLLNTPPVAADDAFTTNEDVPLVLAVLANDTDVEGDSLTAAIVDGPVHGVLAPNGDGTFTYSPDPDFFGEDSFT